MLADGQEKTPGLARRECGVYGEVLGASNDRQPGVTLRLRKTAFKVSPVLTAADSTLRALAEPRRRAILRLVRNSEMAAGQIAAFFDVTRPAISQHLAVLRAAGMLEERRDGTRRLYRARPDAIEGLRAWLDEFWTEGLEQLREHVETEEGRTR